MFNLLPRDTVFFDLFEGLSRHAVDAAEQLRQLVTSFPTCQPNVDRIRQAEQAADELAHQALDRLDRTFITPFDREDIYTLVDGLDNIVDTIDALAKRFKLYHVTQMQPAFGKQTDVLVAATTAVSTAVGRLRKNHKLSALSDQLIEIHRLENVGDDNNHAAVSRLFEGEMQPLDVMKWKEFYDLIEAAIDACEDVGNILERLVLKNG